MNRRRNIPTRLAALEQRLGVFPDVEQQRRAMEAARLHAAPEFADAWASLTVAAAALPDGGTAADDLAGLLADADAADALEHVANLAAVIACPEPAGGAPC